MENHKGNIKYIFLYSLLFIYIKDNIIEIIT